MAYPIRAIFGPEGFITKHTLMNKPQRKGEAEFNHLCTLPHQLGDGDSVIVEVTSADHDLIPILICTVGEHMPKHDNGTYLNTVFAVLVKTGRKYDVYNITQLARCSQLLYQPVFEKPPFCVAMLLAMGGNDFLHKLRPVAHKQWLQVILDNPDQFKELFNLKIESG